MEQFIINAPFSDATGSERAFLPPAGALQDLELRKQARALWKKAAHAKTLTAESCAAYHLLMGGKLNAAFSPITNSCKLQNGADPFAAKENALQAVNNLRSSAFEPWKPLLEEFFLASRYGYLPASAKEHPLIACLKR